MFTRVLVTIDDMNQCQPVLGLVKGVATEGVTEVRALHLRVREGSGFNWRPLETRDQASYTAEAATFEMRMAGLSAGGVVRHAPVDPVPEAVLRAATAFDGQ